MASDIQPYVSLGMPLGAIHKLGESFPVIALGEVYLWLYW